MNLTPLHARAIIRMDNHAWCEDLDILDDDTLFWQAWEELVQAAEEMTGTKTNEHQYRE